MINSSNVKLTNQAIFPIDHSHSDIESYIYATDDCDRYSDYLSDKWTLETELYAKNLTALQA